MKKNIIFISITALLSVLFHYTLSFSKETCKNIDFNGNECYLGMDLDSLRQSIKHPDSFNRGILSDTDSLYCMLYVPYNEFDDLFSKNKDNIYELYFFFSPESKKLIEIYFLLVLNHEKRQQKSEIKKEIQELANNFPFMEKINFDSLFKNKKYRAIDNCYEYQYGMEKSENFEFALSLNIK
jgi:hypothetical protein